MRYLYALIFVIVFNFNYSQNNKVNIGSVEIFLPYISKYNECVDKKISKKYTELFIPKSYDLLGFYLNNETYKFNKLSELYDGLSDFGYLMINKDLKNEFIDDEIFNHLLTYTDSVYGSPNENLIKNKSIDEIYFAKSQLFQSNTIDNKLKTYTSLYSVDSNNLICSIDNHINLKNRYLQFSYYVKIKNQSFINKAISNNNYLVENIFNKNESSISIENASYKNYKIISKESFFTSDGFNLGTIKEFGVLLSEGKEFVDINGIKISPAQFWECNANLYISTLNSKIIADALEKQDFEVFLPNDDKLDEIMKCIGNGFSVGESYIDLCINRYQAMGIYSFDESQKFCRCEYENLLVRVDDYNDYVKYYDEIGDQNKPSYNEIILPCRNSFKKAKGSNLYIPNDIEGFSDQSIVKLLPDGTTFKVKLTISGIVRYFVYDTGASELVINSELENELLKTGKISVSDYVDSKQFEIADGSLIEAKGVRLNNIVIGGFRVNNVVAYITEEGGMLCGMGLMNKFRTWELDKENKMITIYK